MSARYALLSFFLCAVAARGAELSTLKGEKITGDITSITDKEVVITASTGPIATPLSQVLRIDYNPAGALPADPFVDVELIDGSLLHCSKFAINGKDVEVTLLTGQQVKLPLGSVSNILREANVEKYRKEWSKKLADRKQKRNSLDALALHKDGKLNMLDVTLGEGNAKGEIEFTWHNRKLTKALSQIAGMIFEREVNPNAAPVICKVADTSRNLFFCSSVASTTAGLTLTTSAGVTIELIPAQVNLLDFSSSKLAWLSDMEPTEVVEKFIDNNAFHYKRDHNQDDGPIRLDNVQYDRGLSLHATTDLEYDLKGEYREFKTVAGINDLVGGLPGPVVLRIEGDGKLLKELTFDRSNKVRHQAVALNIKDVQKLRIHVGPGGEGPKLDLGLYLDLADAKVSK